MCGRGATSSESTGLGAQPAQALLKQLIEVIVPETVAQGTG